MIAQAEKKDSTRARRSPRPAPSAAAARACVRTYSKFPIETPIQPKLDVSPFQRVLVAGFVAGGNDDVDTNHGNGAAAAEPAPDQVGAEGDRRRPMPLVEIAQDRARRPTPRAAAQVRRRYARPRGGRQRDAAAQEHQGGEGPRAVRAALRQHRYWKKIGEEYQNPLIVTGTVLFTPKTTSRHGRPRARGLRQLRPPRASSGRTYMERKGFVLQPKFIFIDGRTGTTIYSETYHEEVLYPSQQNTPALSSYFELMDRIVPRFLSTLSTQKIKGTRVLLK